MGTIEKNMLNALRESKSVSLANTYVSVNGEEKAVYLHNNKIALFTCGKLYVSLCGWNSVTTRSRLRALGVNITTKQGVPYIGGESVSSYGVYEVDRNTGNPAK